MHERLAFRFGVSTYKIIVVVAAHSEMRPVRKPFQYLPRVETNVNEITGEYGKICVWFCLLHGPERVDIRVDVRDHKQFQGNHLSRKGEKAMRGRYSLKFIFFGATSPSIGFLFIRYPRSRNH